MTNLGRWTIGTSVRSLERFYASPQSWLEQTLTLLSVFFEKILAGQKGFRSGWCLAIDETVGKKSGKKTHGLGYHYSSKEDKVIWHIYQIKNMLSKNFDMTLNVVIIMKYNKKGNLCKATNRIILFCTNKEESHENIIDIYQVRFQIEFNFRDARQYFGLSHFKSSK